MDVIFFFLKIRVSIVAYLKGRFDKAFVTAHTWSVASCQSFRNTTEIFLQSCRYTRTLRDRDNNI